MIDKQEPSPPPARRTQAERSATTRAALLSAARRLFAERGFAEVGTEAIVRAAGVTRGALYHQFADKTELFAAVFEALEEQLAARIVEELAAAGASDPLDELRLGVHAWLDACERPDVQRIALLDAPAVLGWERWREIGWRYGLGLVEAVLVEAVKRGRIAPQPVSALAHVLIGALDEAALYIARAADQAAARAEMEAVVGELLRGLERG
ncbi:MAG TPA: TetR family transcriptional regulator [Solirubrobacteraceae bacterium]|nr:TetR family transcriptional regulator [Solirubrobacteraceae bacterium]